MNGFLIDPLVVEDNASDAELILESLGVGGRVHVARDGVEALDFVFCRGAFADRAFAPPPKLVIVDLKLPKVDGLEVVRQMKSDPRTQPIPVVMLSSSKLEHDVRTAYRNGVNSYVQKPMEFERFRAAVHVVGHYWLSINERPPLDDSRGLE